MYGSYGSYSSMSSASQPLDISPNSYLSRDSAYQASCAYPSWPQRSSLSESFQEERVSSYLSDDDLFPCYGVEDDARSISSASSTASGSPYAEQPFVTEQELLEMQREQMAMQREAVKMLIREKEQRRQAMKKSRSRTLHSKKSSKTKAMAPITEIGE